MHRSLVVWVAAVLLALALPGLALAHPQVVQTEPAAGAELETPPTLARITFSEPVEPSFSTLELVDSQGQIVATGGVADPNDATTLSVALPELGPGIYTAVWRVVGSDGHKVAGNWFFTVLGTPTATPGAGTPTAAAVPTPLPTPTPPPPVPAEPEVPTALLALLRSLMLLGALIGVGAWLVQVGVLFPALQDHSAERAQVVRRWRLIEAGALAVLVLASGGFALAQTASIAGRLDAASLWAMLGTTRLGWALLARSLLALLLAGLLALPPRRWVALPAALLGAGLLLSFSLSGHAAAEAAPLLPVLADFAHLVATTLWVGGLVLLVATLPIFGQHSARVAAVVVRFSQLALASVVVLAASGTYTALLHLGTLSELWSSTYGQALLVKLVVFVVLLALGAYNLLVLRPRFAAWVQQVAASAPFQRAFGQIRTSMAAEVVLVLAAVAAAGLMTSVAPPAKAVSAPTPAPVATAQPSAAPVATAAPLVVATPVPSVPFDGTQQVEDVTVRLQVEPATLGKNNLRVTLTDAQGQPLAAQKVVLRYVMLEMDMGETSEDGTAEAPGTYTTTDTWISMVGEWQIRVLVRRADADDVEADFTVPVGG